MIRSVTDSLLPPGSRRRRLAKRLKTGKATTTAGVSELDYATWIKECEPQLFATSNADVIADGPLISIIVPCYNTPKRYLDELLASVLGQRYQNWQLCLVDGSTDDACSNYLLQLSQRDAKITYEKVGENLGIVGNTNRGLAVAEGQFVAFMDHDDTLSTYALAEVAQVLKKHPKTDLIYSDEDKL